jgi:hypothetical protein
MRWHSESSMHRKKRPKRDARLHPDQAAKYDFTPPRADRFYMFARLRGSFTASLIWKLLLISGICTTKTTASALMPNPCSMDTDFMRHVEAALDWAAAAMWLFRVGRLVPVSVRTRSTSCSGNYRIRPDFVMHGEPSASIEVSGLLCEVSRRVEPWLLAME